MKLRDCVYIIVVSTLFFTSCKKKSDIEEQRYTWSTDAPLSIPYRIRFQRFEKANLIRNPSFESGKIFKLDSATTSFVIDGWQQVGQHIQWVDASKDSLFRSDEVYSGTRAVKIVRHKALETGDQGDGIISDFIKVIPGNYNLSLYVKMENVMPNRARLGTRMFDAIDLRILFYDRNKILLKPDYAYPMEHQVIDNSFKSLSFSNYRSVPSFGWGKVTGKSHHFPFPEGDIPTEAHFVKILIGLKGTGTLWVDSVTFNYTHRNFSVAERMQIFTDTAFHTPEFLIPTPKQYSRMESVIFFKKDIPPEELPLIVIPDNVEESTMKAALIIQEAFRKSIIKHGGNGALGIDIQILSQVSPVKLNQSRLILSLGKTDLYNYGKGSLPEDEIAGHPQGYFIYSPRNFPNLVLLGADSYAGLYYAVITATQMIDNKAPIFHNARIIDYPDFPMRYYTHKNYENPIQAKVQEDLAGELIRYKLNGAILLQNRSSGNVFPFTYPEHELFEMIRVSGYYPPEDSTLTYFYPYKYVNSSVFPADEKILISQVFHNQILDNSDYSELCSKSSEKKQIYSGSSFFSVNTDVADINRFISVMGKKPVFMDNSMLINTPWGHFGGNHPYYPGKIRLFNLFEPFVNQDIEELFPMLDTSMFITNLPVNSEIEIIRLATAADFMWNASDYTPDYSLWKVLMTRYGVENARDLIAYAEKYSQLLEIVTRLELNIQLARNVKTGQQIMADITSLLGEVSGRLGVQNKLVKDLQKINSDLRTRLNHHSKMIPAKK